MEYSLAIIILLLLGYACYYGVRWMMRAGLSNSSKGAQLTPHDLKVLEESAARLINDIKSTTDECVAKIETACLEAERRILIAKSDSMPMPETIAVDKDHIEDEILTESVELKEEHIESEVTEEVIMSAGEKELIDGLRSIGRNNLSDKDSNIS